jgi:hypothetical protein
MSNGFWSLLDNRRPPRRLLRVAFVLCICCLTMHKPTFAADKKYWDLSPYRVQLHLAVENRAKPQVNLGNNLLDLIRQRIDATLYPVWSSQLSLAEGPLRHRLVSGLQALDEKLIDASALQFDKQLYLSVRATALGYVLECREYDCYVRRWGPVLSRRVRQEISLPAQCYDLLRETFAPLATIRPIDKDDSHVVLRFKGSDLPRRTTENLFTELEDVYQPLLVRTSSSGEVGPDGVKEIPWTILSLAEPQEADWKSQVHSGIRTPFGLRRRGRVAHLAIATRHVPRPTSVRFHARHDPTQGLSGYEVFRRETSDSESQLLGFTDAEGAIMVPVVENPVSTLFLRSDGQLLAKIPIAPGAVSQVEVPVADDPARLRAQADLGALREKLIDLVARRTLLMARVRDRLKKGKLGEAQQLYSELDGLPGQTSFEQQISSVENNKLNRSIDARIQARIEKLFADTRKLLGRFLSAREISDLQNELTAARRKEKS